MKKRKLAALAASLCLIAVVGVGATLAYFTDRAEAENVVTMGHVDITLTETEVEKNADGEWVQKEETEITEEGLTFDEVLPGETLPKNPTITVVDGSVDAYVRIKMTVETGAGSKITQDDLDLLKKNLTNEITEGEDWYYNSEDGYFYYKNPLKNGEKAVLFETVTIPGAEWKNNTAGQSFSIKLQAEAIQKDYFTPVVGQNGKITGWGMVDVEARQ